jgi:acetoin utilization deacetylase AcuC-like enzyme
MEHAILVHTPEYANWVFDKTHPTQGRRFLHARNKLMLEAQKRRLNVWEIEPEHCSTDDLHLVHDMSYVFDVVVRGESSEWNGQRHDLGDLAKLFVSGTLTALDTLIDKKTLLAINFAGAKHHAMRDYSSGFCVFADFAIAATKATNEYEHRVAIFDCDAHHGDGTEVLLKSNKNVMTYSVHEYGIFPGTGLLTDWKNRAYNFPLASGSGDDALMSATEGFLDACDEFQPTMIFVACGADGLADDPLSNLKYTPEGYFNSMRVIREQFPTTPILLGGAGGYLPDTGTPEVWKNAALGLMAIQTEVVKP